MRGGAAHAPFATRLADVRKRIDEAALRSGRDPADVTLVGAAKHKPAAAVAEAVRAGLGDVGESYVQEAAGKIEQVAALLAADGVRPPRWHLIGHLQRNKARHAARLFDVVQSVDGAALAEALDRRAGIEGRRIDVLVQVNTSGEAQKSGVAPEALPDLVAAIAGLERIRLVGLMAIPAPVDVAEAARPAFAGLRRLRDELRGRPGTQELRELSMGMSADFEVAIEEGATMVRVGTALFGPRDEEG
jgi:pyridoxal phosphate enzyme (YggS family)